MKNIQSIYTKTMRYQLMALLVLLCFSACRKYNSEFEYNAINDITVNDTNIVGNISLKIGDTLELKPQISQSQLSDEANLEYLWTSYEQLSTINAPISEIARTRNLKMPIGFPFALGKSYLINYKVFDKTTKVSIYRQYRLNVVNDLIEGWLISEDTPEGGDFSMILPSGRVIYNLYSTINGPTNDKAVKAQISSLMIDDGVSPNRKKMYMVTENSATELDYLTFTKTYDFNALFFKAPEVIKPTYMNWSTLSGGALGSIINDGRLHTSFIGGFPGAKKWSGQLVAQGVGLNYRLAPFVANGIAPFNSTITNTTPQYYQALVYDQMSKRFFAGVYPITELVSLPASRSTLFDMNDVGMEMLHMDVGGATYVYNMVMKDAKNDHYFMQIRTTFSIANPSLTLIKNKLTTPDIQNFSSASTSFISPYMFYSAGNKVYRYEPGSNGSKLQHTFPANEQVVQVRCVPPLGEAGFNVGVATWDGVQGRFYRFPLALGGPTAMEIGDYDAVYEGFNKIVDIQYKSR